MLSHAARALWLTVTVGFIAGANWRGKVLVVSDDFAERDNCGVSWREPLLVRALYSTIKSTVAELRRTVERTTGQKKTGSSVLEPVLKAGEPFSLPGSTCR